MDPTYEIRLTPTGRVCVQKNGSLLGEWSVTELSAAMDFLYRKLESDAFSLTLPRTTPELPEDFYAPAEAVSQYRPQDDE